MTRLALFSIALMLLISTLSQAGPAESMQQLTDRVTAGFKTAQPDPWAENVPPVRTRVITTDKVLALT